MGFILVVIGLSIWMVVMAAAVLAPLFANHERSPATMNAPQGSPSGPRRRSSTMPVRLHSDDRIAA